MPESVQPCFEISIHLSVQQASCELLLKIVCGKKYKGIHLSCLSPVRANVSGNGELCTAMVNRSS